MEKKITILVCIIVLNTKTLNGMFEAKTFSHNLLFDSGPMMDGSIKQDAMLKVNTTKRTPLSFSAFNQKRKEDGQQKLTFVVEKNTTYKYQPNLIKKSPAHKAMDCGDLKTVQTILEKNKTINQIDPITGKTFLHKAVFSNNITFVRHLLALGANYCIKDDTGRDPLASAMFLTRELNQDRQEIIAILQKHRENNQQEYNAHILLKHFEKNMPPILPYNSKESK